MFNVWPSVFLRRKPMGIVTGRNYEVWFAPILPYSTGPWKLSGLPGLMLKAYDTEKQVEFLFQSMEKIEGEKRSVLPVKTKRQTLKNLMR